MSAVLALREPDACGAQLKAFLKERRSRISAPSVGLPSRSRSGGLRREDVAELLGVSPLWYALFESGTSRRRFSASFLRRVGEILRLDADERDMLTRLVLASGTAARDVGLLDSDQRSIRSLEEVANAAHALARAGSATHALSVAVGALRSVLASARPTFAIAKDERAAADARWLRTALPSAHCLLRVSLSDARQSYGVLCIGSPIPNAYSNIDKNVAKVVGQQLTHALERVRGRWAVSLRAYRTVNGGNLPGILRCSHE